PAAPPCHGGPRESLASAARDRHNARMKYRNLADLHRRQADRLGGRTALSYRRHGLYHDVAWEQYRADTVAAAAALVSAGVRPGDRVGLVSENRYEWLVADLAILAAG